MKSRRLGNNDIHLIITDKELSQLERLVKENLTEKKVALTSKLETYSQDSLKGTEVQLVYDPDSTYEGLDGRDVVPHFNNPPIPIYISNRGIRRLQNREYCGGAVFDTKIEMRVETYLDRLHT